MFSEADSLYQLDWYKSSLRNCCCAAKDETKLSALLLAHLSPSPIRDLRAVITPLFRLSKLCSLLHVLTTLSVCTASTTGIIGENLTGGLGSALSERPIREEVRSYITASPAKLTDGSISSPNAKTSEEEDAVVSLYLSLATSRQVSASEANS
ncbi:hypothetical protein AYI68_g3332 [Smittium mucronatum]|uniref:Uncharacterized protein n=1 Tax=Smittium mucronatum TaxID=133383 RepID=A0A1R0H090_9FUNG|nr:hypothetical protein AYI68_g3332 [Smittium mucronatum]